MRRRKVRCKKVREVRCGIVRCGGCDSDNDIE